MKVFQQLWTPCSLARPRCCIPAHTNTPDPCYPLSPSTHATLRVCSQYKPAPMYAVPSTTLTYLLNSHTYHLGANYGRQLATPLQPCNPAPRCSPLLQPCSWQPSNPARIWRPPTSQQSNKPASRPPCQHRNPYTLHPHTPTPAILHLCPAPLHRPASWYPCNPAPLHSNKPAPQHPPVSLSQQSRIPAPLQPTQTCTHARSTPPSIAPRLFGPLHIETLRAYAHTSTHFSIHLHCNTVHRYAANLRQ